MTRGGYSSYFNRWNIRFCRIGSDGLVGGILKWGSEMLYGEVVLICQIKII